MAIYNITTLNANGSIRSVDTSGDCLEARAATGMHPPASSGNVSTSRIWIGQSGGTQPQVYERFTRYVLPSARSRSPPRRTLRSIRSHHGNSVGHGGPRLRDLDHAERCHLRRRSVDQRQAPARHSGRHGDEREHDQELRGVGQPLDRHLCHRRTRPPTPRPNPKSPPSSTSATSPPASATHSGQQSPPAPTTASPSSPTPPTTNNASNYAQQEPVAANPSTSTASPSSPSNAKAEEQQSPSNRPGRRGCSPRERR